MTKVPGEELRKRIEKIATDYRQDGERIFNHESFKNLFDELSQSLAVCRTSTKIALKASDSLVFRA